MDHNFILRGNSRNLPGWNNCNNSASLPSSCYVPHGLQVGSARTGGSFHVISVGEDTLELHVITFSRGEVLLNQRKEKPR